MTRILTVLFFTCVLSVSFCRHLENTVSDARTIRKPVDKTTDNDFEGSKATPTSTSASESQTTGTPPSQTLPTPSNLGVSVERDADVDMPLPIAFTSTTSETTSASPVAKPSENDGKAHDVDKHVLDILPSSLTEGVQTPPATETKHDVVNTGVTDGTESHVLSGNHKPTVSNVGTNTENLDSTVNNNNNDQGVASNENPISAVNENDGKVGYEKNHGQLESNSASLPTAAARLGSDNKEMNIGSELPYVKLDNINNVGIDTSSPVVRPELNHIDNNIDQVKRIDAPTSSTPTTGATDGMDGSTPANIDDENSKVSTHQPSSAIDPTPTDISKHTNTVSNGESLSAEINQMEDEINEHIDKGSINTDEQTQTPAEISTWEDETIAQVFTTTPITTTVRTTTKPTTKGMQGVDINPSERTTDNVNTNRDVQNIGNKVVVEEPVKASGPVDTGDDGFRPVVQANTAATTDDEVDVPATLPVDAALEREPDDVDPLDIFVDDIKYQRFPEAMPLAMFKDKVAGQSFKKLYILESADKKLFQHVRQLEVTYLLEGDDLYAEFLFRFIYSRQCTKIEKFKLGTLSKDSEVAMFEKEIEGGDQTERLVFFSKMPDDYVFFMSCTDYMTSPYACRDTYYVTLDSKHDPPNQFPWLHAAKELNDEMKLSFQDPRFVFNFVMMPCARE